MLDSLAVNEREPPLAQKTQLSLAGKLGWTALVLATLSICYFSHLGALGFVGPDEPRYAWIARDMTETGDWVTPHLYGKPWFEKPPLFYWGAALCFKLFGVNEAAARLPSAISALLATLAMAWLAWRIYGAETARWLLLLLPTTVGMIGFSHAAATDMPFSGMFTIVMVCAAVVLRLVPGRREEAAAGPVPTEAAETVGSTAPPSSTPSVELFANRTPWLALVLFGFFLGLAVLAKGPVGIALCGGAVLGWALITKRWRDAFRLLHPVAIAAFCATALPWYILCARRNPDFFRIFIIEHNFKRYLTPEFQHIQPFWFYIPIVLVALLPWTALLMWSGAVGTLRGIRERRISSCAAFFVSWSLFCLLFFSISQSKLPGYILPAIPAFGFCMVRLYVHILSMYRLSLRFIQFLASAALLGAGAILMLFGRASRQGSAKAAVAYGIVAVLLGFPNLIVSLSSIAWRRDRIPGFAGGFAVLPILALLLFSSSLLPSLFSGDPSGRTLASELKARGVPSEQVYVSFMGRGQQYSLDFYLRSETKRWDREHPSEGYVLAGASVIASIAPATWSCMEIPFDTRSTGYFLYRVQPDSSARSSRSNGGG